MYATVKRKMTSSSEIKNQKLSRIEIIRAEVRRISNVTLRGVFAKQEDREFWEVRLKKLNGELSALEQEVKPSKP